MAGSCDARHHAWPLFLETHAVLVELLGRELEAEADLPLTWFEVLIKLNDAPEGRLRMNDLADSLYLSKSGVTRLVDRMADAGLISRASCAQDRRVVYAQITKKGRTRFERAAPIAFRGVNEHFGAHLSATEERALISAFTKIVRAARAAHRTRAAS